MLIDTTPLDRRARAICGRSQFQQVRSTSDEPLFNSLIEQHHYLGYEQPVGEHLKYLVWAQGRPIACMAWSSSAASSGQPRSVYRLERGSAPAQHPLHCLQHAIPDSAVGAGAASGIAHPGPHGGAPSERLGTALWSSGLLCWRPSSIPGASAARVIARPTGSCWDARPGAAKSPTANVPNRSIKEVLGYPLTPTLPRVTESVMKKKTSRRRVDVNVEELDRIIDDAAQGAAERGGEPEAEDRAACAGRATAAHSRKTEKTNAVLGDQDTPAPSKRRRRKRSESTPAGHGRNGANAYRGAEKVARSRTRSLHSGDRCPECGRGNVYEQKEPKALVRIVGQAPLAATVYELERLRCNACGQVFTAQEPEGVGPEKYDETAAAMIAQLKYGSGIPFYRLEQMEEQLGIPLPASTQWEIVEEAAEVMKPAHEELIRQAAQGEVLHNDDTSMRVLRLAREPSDERTGVFTSGIVRHRRRSQDRAVLHGPPACGREHGRRAEAARRRSCPRRFRCAMRCRETCRKRARRGDPAGQLSGAWKAAVCGDCAELSGRVPIRAGDAGRGLLQRCRGA